MVCTIGSLHHPDHFFSAPAARPGRWRELNDKRIPDPLVPFGHDNCCHVIEPTVSQSFGAQTC